MRRVCILIALVMFISPPHFSTTGQVSVSESATTPGSEISNPVQRQLEGDFGTEKIVATNALLGSSGVVDWMGPLAPLAISPFFGVTCLSGLAQWGPEWVQGNSLIGSAGPLKNPWLFGLFLVLTVMTSVPRFTKVSKPLAQAVDRLEAYAVIIILLAIKLFAVGAANSPEPVAMVQLGVVSFTLDTLLGVAMVINILVINSVKFFFEFLVWLTPIPLLDAIFEICNKSICAILMAVYAFSPTIATVINVSLFLLAAIIFRWINRRVRFYRTMTLDPIVARIWPSWAHPPKPRLVVFPKQELGPFPAKSRLYFQKQSGGDGWEVCEATWWLPGRSHPVNCDTTPTIRRGWLMHVLEVSEGDDEHALVFSRRYDTALDALAEQIGLNVAEQTEEEQSHSNLAGEFA